MLFGRGSKKILLTHPKTNSSIFSCQTRLELGTGFYGRMKLKIELFGSKPTNAGGPEHLVQMHGIMDPIKYQQIKNLNLSASVRNLITGRVWIFHQDNNPKQTSKSTQKWFTQNESSAMAVPVLWPEPCRKWVRWTEEKKHRHGAVNLKDLERFWMKEWSLISKLFRHYRRKLRAVILGKGRCNNWVPIIVANMN